MPTRSPRLLPISESYRTWSSVPHSRRSEACQEGSKKRSIRLIFSGIIKIQKFNNDAEIPGLLRYRVWYGLDRIWTLWQIFGVFIQLVKIANSIKQIKRDRIRFLFTHQCNKPLWNQSSNQKIIAKNTYHNASFHPFRIKRLLQSSGTRRVIFEGISPAPSFNFQDNTNSLFSLSQLISK